MNRLSSSNRLPKNLLLFTMITVSVAAQAAPSATVIQGSYTSYQINVDASGQNIVGDKGNEPSIAVNPLNPNNIVIGWRKFGITPSNDKQAGFANTFDGGVNWTIGELPSAPLQQRTDPSLDTDSQGNFYYQSMGHGSVNQSSVFKSLDGGITWSNPVDQFLGDKNWMAIDKSNGNSSGHIYSTWRKALSAHPDPNYVPKYFIRSTDGGISYQEPDIELPLSNFGFGRIAVGRNGDVYLSGFKENVISSNAISIVRNGFYFLKSENAKDPTVSPTFSVQKVDMGGNVVGVFSPTGPNLKGADGDVQIVADVSSGVLGGNIYMFAFTQKYGWQVGDDPMDVTFIRSEDGGDTWSASVQVNDDAPGSQSYQWFPMLGVAPNSRIDAVWYDTRNGAGNISQLYYSYSWDGGVTWSENTPVTPYFDTFLPSISVNDQTRQKDKIGDYTHLVSDTNGAHIAYAATYNGEHDVYYLNVFPDCNNNAVSDVKDITQSTSVDVDNNHIPDECEIVVIPGDLDADGDVDRDDMSIILAARNQLASGESDPKDINKDGKITVRDARVLRALCTRPRCVTH